MISTTASKCLVIVSLGAMLAMGCQARHHRRFNRSRTHDRPDAEALADRIVVMGQPEDLTPHT
jgi:hypothetical protein